MSPPELDLVASSAHFSTTELACRCCGAAPMVREYLERLERVRARYGAPMSISSGYRCPRHNTRVSSTGASGPHTTGRAVDVRVSGRAAFRLLDAALLEGMTGIGIAQRGPHGSRFVHLDDLEGGSRPWIWSY